MKMRLPRSQTTSNILVLAAMVALVGFGFMFGPRWALLAAVPCLLLLGVAFGSGES